MRYDPLFQPYHSNRYCITAVNGMVATGSGLASAAGLEILRRGGNAIDAAVATAAALTVVEPTANGLGSDAFALVWMKDKLYGLNGSGYSPYDISLEDVRKKNPEGMPSHGWTPVMVPGAVKSWQRLVERFGKLSLKEDLQPAIEYAEKGYPLSPFTAKMWESATRTYHKRFDGKKEYAEWFKVFTKDGEPYHFSEIVKLPDHARSLRLIGETNAKAFYEGEIAEQFVRQSSRDGGYFRYEDLKDYDAKWVDPISINYRGYDVCEIPPNGQGIVALMALNILKEFEFKEKECADTYHKQIEAIKLAFADAKHYVTDIEKMSIDYKELLSPEYGAYRAKEITDIAGTPMHGDPHKSGTVYLCTADNEGNMVSYIQSNYYGFGSGIVLEGYGVSLQNRGADFSLKEEDINVLAPHKKSYHTIIPGFLCKDGKAVGPFGVMGGYMQPQGHVQTLMNRIDFGLNPQMALDAPRWQWMKDKQVSVEPCFSKDIADQLLKMGHEISFASEGTSFGRGQIIERLDNGVLVGAAESRTDSNIAAY
ncbi:MAG: gamma-glutamyltransferase family protein [Erysipelotrichaceae bacterium]|nr:gamma-glutamyltransferase family protein [Erysipelotrichaceae bacterium]